MMKTLEHIKEQGLNIAIDDFGVGFSGLQLLYRVEPDYIKIDRFFIAGIHEDTRKRFLLAHIVDIARLLGTSAGATAAWAHFLAFDLFVGRWAYLDSRERNISAWIMAPVLFLILMLGPLGFAMYLGVRALSHSHSRSGA